MTNHPTRGRLRLAPLSVNPRHGLILLLPSRLEAIAFTIWTEPLAPDGLLVRVKHSGAFAVWRGVRIEQIDQRKATAAVAALESDRR